MSVDFFGIGGSGQIGNLKKNQKVQTEKSSATSDDKVQFSSMLRDMNQTGTGNSAEATRAERIEQLKQQIQDGSYQPDLNKVSASLLKFIVNNK